MCYKNYPFYQNHCVKVLVIILRGNLQYYFVKMAMKTSNAQGRKEKVKQKTTKISQKRHVHCLIVKNVWQGHIMSIQLEVENMHSVILEVEKTRALFI